MVIVAAARRGNAQALNRASLTECLRTKDLALLLELLSSFIEANHRIAAVPQDSEHGRERLEFASKRNAEVGLYRAQLGWHIVRVQEVDPM